MGQAIFLVVLAALTAAVTAWAAGDLRTRGSISGVAALALRLLAVLVVVVFVTTATAGTWPSGTVLLPRVLITLVLLAAAVLELHPHLSGGGAPDQAPDPPLARVLGLCAAGAAVLADSAASLLLVAVAALAARALLAARAEHGPGVSA